MLELSRNVKDQWLDEKDKRESRKSIFYFGKFVLGYNLEVDPHKRICDFIQDPNNKFCLALLPRGSFKTSIVSQIYPLWLLINNPNIRILMDSEVLRNSERNLGVIKNILEGNQRFRYLFGDFVNLKHWTQSEITIAQRTNFNLKEPSIGTASTDTIENGPHWDVIIPDDLHSDKNSRNKDQIDNVYEHFRLLFSLLEPDGIIRMIGTRWADMDTYGRIIENHPSFKVIVEKAIRDDGSLFFPKRLTQDALARIRKEEGIDMFSCQYQNDPIPKGDSASFRKEWFKYSENKDIPLYITVDPAIGASDSSDYFAIAVGGMSSLNDIFIENYVFARMQPYVAIDKIFNLWDQYAGRVKAIAIETNAFQKMFKFAFDLEMKKRNKFIKIIELKHSKSKDERIFALQPRYQSNSIYHKHWMKDGELEEELLKFPKGRRDDVIDAVASLLEILSPKRLPRASVVDQKEKEKYGSIDKYISYHIDKRRTGMTRRLVHPTLGRDF